MTPTDWKLYKLGDLVTFQRGHDLPKEQIVKGKYPVAGSNGIIGYHNSFTTIGPGITIGRSGNIGTPYFYTSNFWAHNTTLYVKEFKGCNPKFIYYLLKTMDFAGHNSGSAVPSLNRNYIHPIEIFAPVSESEQSRIATILSSLDDKIELNLQMNKTLEAIAQAIFKEWFVDFRFTGFDGVLVDGLPRGWLMRKLNQVAQVEIGRTPPRMENQWFSVDNRDIKWISIRDMGNSGIFIFNTSEYLTSAAIEKFRIPVIPPNTVVLSFKLTIGRVGITTERMVSNEAIAQIKSDTLDSGYIYCLLKNYHFDSLGSTSSIATAINSKIIKEMVVLVPEQKVVDEFCRIAGPVFNKIKNNSLEIKTLTQIRDSLLPRLMTGKIKVA